METEHLGYKLVALWDSRVASGGFTHYVPVLALALLCKRMWWGGLPYRCCPVPETLQVFHKHQPFSQLGGDPLTSVMVSCFEQNVEVLAHRSSASEQNKVGAELREKLLKEENEKLQGKIAELERRVAQLQRHVEDLQGDEAKAKDALKKSEVRLFLR